MQTFEHTHKYILFKSNIIEFHTETETGETKTTATELKQRMPKGWK